MKIRMYFVSYDQKLNVQEPIRTDSFYLNLSDSLNDQAQEVRIGSLATIMSQRMSAKHRIAMRFDRVQFLDPEYNGREILWDIFDWKSLVSDDYFDYQEDPEVLDAENNHGQKEPTVCNHRIEVHQLGSGWAAVHLADYADMDWNTDYANTGIGRYADKSLAINEAKEWAINEEMPFIMDGKEVDLSVERAAAESLFQQLHGHDAYIRIQEEEVIEKESGLS